MNYKIFVYGTLLIPAVMEAVTGKTFETTKAALNGYARYRLKGRVYPGIIAAQDQSVEGLVCHGLDKYALDLLDTFEGDEYQRIRVTVTADGGGRISAFTYIITPAYSKLVTKQDWELDSFVKQHLKDYFQRIKKKDVRSSKFNV